MTKLSAVLAAAIIATPLLVLAEGTPGNDDMRHGKTDTEKMKDTGALSQADANVIRKLHHANEMEVEAGNLAKSKGDSKAVKAFGEELARDHAKADNDVRDLAKKKKLSLAAQ